ncbi:MAG: hypothetical protein EZS28_038632 [Streblomastix strix]|uniref:CR-type domain-containing protein n=1 Tax=Streblomastix strix TaxID=222440 RepID=A0A5J4U7I8_9EUKA|nr:MAG: hypothetical protein EZS28_038632 [Streblomastix strix]
MICSACNGRGERTIMGNPLLKQQCLPCRGKGKLQPNETVCSECNGNGEISVPGSQLNKQRCYICNGQGKTVNPIVLQPNAPVNIITGFHQTDPGSASQILSHGFKLGNAGIAGGGIYFALNKNDTNQKAHSHGTVLKCLVDVGRAKIMSKFEPALNGQKLAAEGYDSVFLPTGDGVNLSANEYVVYDPQRVKKIEKV